MQLLSSRLGSHIAGESVNHIAYVDDMVLLAPSIRALQTLIDICFKFVDENDLLYKKKLQSSVWLSSHGHFSLYFFKLLVSVSVNHQSLLT